MRSAWSRDTEASACRVPSWQRDGHQYTYRIQRFNPQTIDLQNFSLCLSLFLFRCFHCRPTRANSSKRNPCGSPRQQMSWSGTDRVYANLLLSVIIGLLYRYCYCLRCGVAHGVTYAATMSDLLYFSHLSYNHSWFIHQSSLVVTRRDT
jgi:hypothetical protein